MPKMPSAMSFGLSLAIPVAIPVLLSASRSFSAKDTIMVLKKIKDVTFAILDIVIEGVVVMKNVSKGLKAFNEGLKLLKETFSLLKEIRDILFQWEEWIQWAKALCRQWNIKFLLITLLSFRNRQDFYINCIIIYSALIYYVDC
jgi:hypothetical protein